MNPSRLKVLLSILAVVTLACTQLAQAPQLSTATHGQPNGRFWVDLDSAAKLAYILGVSDGALQMAAELMRRPQAAGLKTEIGAAHESFVTKVSYGEIQKQIDAFYKDATNARIPIVDAYTYCLMRIKGATPKELDVQLNLLRASANR